MVARSCFGQRVRRLQAELEVPVARPSLGERLELHEQRRHEVERQLHLRKLAHQRGHPVVVLQPVHAYPRQHVLAGCEVFVVRLVHVPEDGDVSHVVSSNRPRMLRILDRYVLRELMAPFGSRAPAADLRARNSADSAARRNADCRRRVMGRRRPRAGDARAAGARHHHPDGAARRHPHHARPPLWRPRDRRDGGVRRQPRPSAASAAALRRGCDGRHDLRHDRRAACRKSSVPRDYVQAVDDARRNQDQAARVLHGFSESRHLRARSDSGRRLDRCDGIRQQHADAAEDVSCQEGTSAARRVEAHRADGADRRHASLRQPRRAREIRAGHVRADDARHRSRERVPAHGSDEGRLPR